MTGNPNITNCSHMTKLKILDVCDNSGIGQASIDALNLDKLCCARNKHIKKISRKLLLRRKIDQFVLDINKIFFVENDEYDHEHYKCYCHIDPDFFLTTDESPYIVRETTQMLSNKLINEVNFILDEMQLFMKKRRVDFDELEYQPQFKKMRLK